MTYEKLQALTSRPVKIYRPRSPKKLATAQHEAHGGYKLRGLRVAFVPVSQPKAPAKITISKNGKLIVRQNGVKTTRINISTIDLVIDPIASVNNAIAGSTAKQFGIQAGELHRVESRGAESNKILAFSPPHLIAEQVAKLTSQYGADKYDPDDSNSHYFGNWLFGVIAYEYEKFNDYRAHQAAYGRQRDLIKRSSIGRRLAALEKAKAKKSKPKRKKRRATGGKHK
jgi:hypothetical protein